MSLMYLRINSHVVSRGRLLEPYGPGLWFPVAFNAWTSDGDEAVMFHVLLALMSRHKDQVWSS